MWLRCIEFVIDHVPVFFLLMFKLLRLSHRIRVHNLIVHSHLRTGLPCLIYLSHHRRIEFTHRALIIDVDSHLTEHLHKLLQLLVLFSQLTDKLVGFALVDDGLILNLFGLIGVTKSGESLLVVIGGWRDGADHKGFRVTTQCVLEDTS